MKVDDFLRNKLTKEISSIAFIDEHTFDGKTRIYLKNNDVFVEGDDRFEQWNPFPGEYVWDKDYGLSIVLKNTIEDGILCEHLFFKTSTNGTEFTAAINDLYPFFGTLPFNLKDQK